MATKKVSANLPIETIEQLQDMAEKHGTSMTEILRRSIATQAFLEEEDDSGSRVILESPSTGDRRQVLFG